LHKKSKEAARVDGVRQVLDLRVDSSESHIRPGSVDYETWKEAREILGHDD
jgi:hypothetical protein